MSLPPSDNYADLAVRYINQWQRRQVPDQLMTSLAGLEPAFVLRLNGLTYGYVYDIRNVPRPDCVVLSQAS